MFERRRKRTCCCCVPRTGVVSDAIITAVMREKMIIERMARMTSTWPDVTVKPLIAQTVLGYKGDVLDYFKNIGLLLPFKQLLGQTIFRPYK